MDTGDSTSGQPKVPTGNTVELPTGSGGARDIDKYHILARAGIRSALRSFDFSVVGIELRLITVNKRARGKARWGVLL